MGWARPHRAARHLVLLLAALAWAGVGASSSGAPPSKAGPGGAPPSKAGPGGAIKAKPTGAAKAKPADAKDTHQRIEKIYQRLGIEPEQKELSRGCGGGRIEQHKDQDKPSRRGLSMPPALGYVLLGVVLAAMLIPLLLALRSGYREVPESGGATADDELDDPTVAVAPWRVDLDECRRLVAAGRVAEALAALHRLTLLALERTGHLTLDSTTTNWEYVRQLTSRPALRRMLAAVTEGAERAVLGHRPPGVERYRELEALVREGVQQ